MGDFIELGLEGCDKLIDKHFDKLPNHYTDPQTYRHPRRSRTQRHQEGQEQEQGQRKRGQSAGESDYYNQPKHIRSPSPPSPFSEYPPNTMANGRPRGDANSSVYMQDGPFVSPPFSNMPPMQRPEYNPSNVNERERDRDYYNPSASGGRPSQQMRRRSSSYHGPRQSERFYSSDDDSSDDRSRRGGRNNQLATREKDGRSSHGNASRGSGHHHLKDEVAGQFTKSKEGLAGGALGALVAGWATHKVLESKGKGNDDADKAWTLLGAAVGGLAVNSIVDKLEDRREDRREEKREERRSGEKGRSGGSERGRNERSRRDYESDEEERRYYR